VLQQINQHAVEKGWKIFHASFDKWGCYEIPEGKEDAVGGEEDTEEDH
jgi:hypothetical protein